MNYKRALEYLGFSPEDYIIEGDDFTMIEKIKPSQEELIAADQEVQLNECDVVFLINEFLKDKERDPENDSLNIVNGRIYSWDFTHVPRPSYSELLALRESVESKLSQSAINLEAEEYLKSTDWYILRELDSGVLCSIEIKQLRQEARNRIVR